MEIHELNTFSGTLGSGDYFATDNGNDTSKVSAESMFAPLNARIDNIIAGPAPSAEEIVDARRGADGVTYPSLGDAIRTQVTDVKSDIKGVIEGYMPVHLGQIIANSYVDNTNGAFTTYDGWSRTDYIDCSGYSQLKIDNINTASRYNAFYNANKQFISAFSCYQGDIVNIPDGASYLAFSNTNGGIVDFKCSLVISQKPLIVSHWKSKVCACIGSSYTANGGWTDVLKERFGFSKMYNRGRGGTTLANYSDDGFQDYVTSISLYDNPSVWDEEVNTCYYDADNVPVGYETYTHNTIASGWYSATTRINTLPQDADLVIVDLAVNDYFRLYGHLNWDERVNVPQINTAYRQWANPPTYDDTNFGDAFVLMVQGIMNRCPNAKILVWGMIYNSAICNYDAEQGRSSDALSKWDSLINTINSLCETFGITFVNTQHDAGINVFNLTDYCEDGIHPYKTTYETEKGKYAVANVLTDAINNIYPKDYMNQ